MTDETKFLTPVKAIRAKCLDCCSGQVAEVRLCTATRCALHPYRMGKRPGVSNRAPMTEEAKASARDRLAAARAAKVA